jgi:hypothetical protein
MERTGTGWRDHIWEATQESGHRYKKSTYGRIEKNAFSVVR